MEGGPWAPQHNYAPLSSTCATTRQLSLFSQHTALVTRSSEYPSHHMPQSTYCIRDYGSMVYFLEPSIWTLESKTWSGLGWAVGGPQQGPLIFTPKHYGLEWTQIRLL